MTISQSTVSPFASVRLRRLLTWPAAGILILFGLTYGLLKGTEGWKYRVSLVSYEIAALTFAWMYLECRSHGVSCKRLFGRRPNRIQDWALVLLSIPLLLQSIGTFWVGEWARYYFVEWVGNDLVTQLVYSPIRKEDWTAFLLFSRSLMNIVLAPIAGGLLFRGVILHRLSYRFGLHKALLAVSFLDALVHRDVLGVFLFSLLMALLYIRTGSLWVSIITHSLYNGLIVLTEIWPQNWDRLHCLIVGVAITILAIWRFWPVKDQPLPYFRSEQESSQ